MPAYFSQTGEATLSGKLQEEAQFGIVVYSLLALIGIVLFAIGARIDSSLATTIGVGCFLHGLTHVAHLSASVRKVLILGGVALFFGSMFGTGRFDMLMRGIGIVSLIIGCVGLVASYRTKTQAEVSKRLGA